MTSRVLGNVISLEGAFINYTIHTILQGAVDDKEHKHKSVFSTTSTATGLTFSMKRKQSPFSSLRFEKFGSRYVLFRTLSSPEKAERPIKPLSCTALSGTASP